MEKAHRLLSCWKHTHIPHPLTAPASPGTGLATFLREIWEVIHHLETNRVLSCFVLFFKSSFISFSIPCLFCNSERPQAVILVSCLQTLLPWAEITKFLPQFILLFMDNEHNCLHFKFSFKDKTCIVLQFWWKCHLFDPYPNSGSTTWSHCLRV